ncbi:hypothetical protein EMIHUDRAFT_451491 [Emiliania huxleyi CCMP1516]|uniref:Ubiquitin-like protease family profile domain-containing protein n=2 Tax=Emiliania huxleyi TaxID=2903 RepID=A0A0D3J021_EMIH1|nr:hypothetical protein EMIHUDRAFT_451491 [Emiliania huxleyi CCMP1516]EOD16856.1 hypothetical protein EMIHUDRAFT_451491 [Emiliania huxleyi CCMP1516]|eukprot:XP_005769285.1 hypothetical protein EMIHUDRAFT_451491 [Emiliania huxleyi CCMP1516]
MARSTNETATMQPLLVHQLCECLSCGMVGRLHLNNERIDLRQLVSPGSWLGDETINAFLYVVQQRCRGRVVLLNTHFLKLLGGHDFNSFDYHRVRRWTAAKRLRELAGLDSIRDAQLVCVPVHAGSKHWWLALCDLRARGQPILWCFDSARDACETWDPSRGEKALRCLARWLAVEGVVDAHAGRATLVLAPQCAPQRDAALEGDCAVFTCAAADSAAAMGMTGGFPYSSADMQAMRWRIARALVVHAFWGSRCNR